VFRYCKQSRAVNGKPDGKHYARRNDPESAHEPNLRHYRDPTNGRKRRILAAGSSFSEGPLSTQLSQFQQPVRTAAEGHEDQLLPRRPNARYRFR